MNKRMIVSLIASFPTALLAAPSAAPAQQAAASTMPAGKADLSSPRAAAAAFAKAADAGDAAAARAATLSDPKQQEMVGEFVKVIAAVKQFREAVSSKFGADGSSALGTVGSIELSKTLDGAKEDVNGDTATLTPAPDQARNAEPVYLKKEGSDWKVDFSDRVREADDSLPRMRAISQVYAETAQEIRAGKYASFADVEQAMATKKAQAQGGAAPSSGPAAP